MALTKTDEYQAAARERDRDKINELRKNLPQLDKDAWSKRFAEAAAGREGSDAFPYLSWLARVGTGEHAAAAIDTLVESYEDHPEMTEVVARLPYQARALGMDKVRGILDTLVERSKNASVRAHALAIQAQMVMRDRNASAEDKAAAQEKLDQAVELDPEGPVADAANAEQFQKERLQVGMEAPDIEGVDLDGVPFKLSDYRGKVVVLDFWGDW